MKTYLIACFGDVLEFDSGLAFKQIQEACAVDDFKYVERVNVWYDGKQCTMYVNEEGALRGAPANARATAIYWTAACKGRTGVAFDPLQMPMIYGNAVLQVPNQRS